MQPEDSARYGLSSMREYSWYGKHLEFEETQARLRWWHMGELGVKQYSHGLNFVVIMTVKFLASRRVALALFSAFEFSGRSSGSICAITGEFSAVEVALHFTGTLLMLTCYGSSVILKDATGEYFLHLGDKYPPGLLTLLS